MWADTVDGSYKNCIYKIGTYYIDSMSPSSMSEASVGGFDVDDEVCETVFKFNAKL